MGFFVGRRTAFKVDRQAGKQALRTMQTGKQTGRQASMHTNYVEQTQIT